MIEVQDSLRMRLSRRELLKYTGTALSASALGALLVACGGDDDDDDDEDDPTATVEDQALDEDPTATEEDEDPTATEEDEPTATEEEDEPTATEEEDEPTATEEPSPTEEPTNTPEPTATDEPEPTATDEPEPTNTPVPEPTNTPEPTPTEAAPEPQTLTVNMTDDLIFDPPQISINVGDTIVWVNVGAAPHTATCDPNLAMDPASVNLPDGAAPWDTGIINEGESGSHTFDTPGEYTYFCIPHEAVGMIAQVSVSG